jgi:hypothetical protein
MANFIENFCDNFYKLPVLFSDVSFSCDFHRYEHEQIGFSTKLESEDAEADFDMK